MHPSVKSFLDRNREKFASRDGLPAEFHRQAIFRILRPGATAAIVTPHGSILSGRIVLRARDGQNFVMNAGGRHGTPAVVTSRNVVFASGAAAALNLT